MPEEMIPADKKLRKTTIILLIVFVLGLMLLSPFLNSRLAEWKQTAAGNPETAFRQFSSLFRWLLGITALLVSAASVYLIVIALRVLKADRYPPPGLKVIRDTRLRTGRPAKITAYVLMVNSVILIVLVSLIFFLFARMAERMRTPPETEVRPFSRTVPER
ncbi:MAG: hypothetical protein HY892_17765 [Deltaproteobacteria bacterium]|nr:hypothetical protein [Deltaproteobacteria bacterium]